MKKISHSEILDSLLGFEKRQAADVMCQTLGFNGFLQVLDGKKDGDYLINRFFWITLGNMILCRRGWQGDDSLKAEKRNKQFDEAIATYFLRILSQQEQLTYEKMEMIEPFLLSLLLVLSAGCHSGLQRALYERGVIEGFRQRILNYTPDDDLLMTSLSLFMVHGCRFCECCPKLEAKDCEKALSAMAQCLNCGANRLPNFLILELLFSLAQIIQAGQRTPRVVDAVREGLVKHDLTTTVLKRLVPEYLKVSSHSTGRLVTAMVIVLHLPSILINVATTDAYLEFVLEVFNKRYVSADGDGIGHNAYVVYLHFCWQAMGETFFQEKFLPKLVKVWPPRFLDEVYTVDRSSLDLYERSLVNYIAAAALFDRAGRFNGHQKLASIVVELFLTGRPWSMYPGYLFLQKTYRFPEFKPEELRKVPLCTEEVLNDIYSALSFVVPTPPGVVANDLGVAFDLGEKKRSGNIRVIASTGVTQCLICKSKYPTESVCPKCGPKLPKDHEPITNETFIRAVSYPKSASKSNKSKPNPTATEQKATSTPKITITPETNAGGLKKADDKKASFLFVCDSCGLRGNDLLMCGRCQDVYYCNQDCQRADWKRGHKQACKILADARTSKT